MGYWSHTVCTPAGFRSNPPEPPLLWPPLLCIPLMLPTVSIKIHCPIATMRSCCCKLLVDVGQIPAGWPWNGIKPLSQVDEEVLTHSNECQLLSCLCVCSLRVHICHAESWRDRERAMGGLQPPTHTVVISEWLVYTVWVSDGVMLLITYSHVGVAEEVGVLLSRRWVLAPATLPSYVFYW